MSCFRFLLCSFFFSSRRRHTRWPRDWSSDVCSSDLLYTIVSCFLPVALRVSSGSGVSGLDGAFCFGQGDLLLFSTGDDATVCIASTPVCELLLSVVNEVGGCFGGCVFHCVLLLPLFLLLFYHTR